MALFRERDGFISTQVSEISHKPLGEWKIGDECWDNPSRTSAEITHLTHLCTFKHFHHFIFHQCARWVYLGPGVKVGSLFWSARMVMEQLWTNYGTVHVLINLWICLYVNSSSSCVLLNEYQADSRTYHFQYTWFVLQSVWSCLVFRGLLSQFLVSARC